MPVPEIAVVLVSWQDAAEAEAAVASLAAARRRIPTGGPRVSLVVVGNGGEALRRDRILSLWPGATLIVNAENRGFGPAANQGAELASGDLLLFVNPDTRADGDPFTALSHAFASRPEAVAVAPRLLDFDPSELEGVPGRPLAPPDREDQFTFQLRRMPTLASDARELLLLDHLRPNNRGRRRFRYADRDPERSSEVEQAAAAALAVRKLVFRRVGGFDERFVPAWFEDVDLCAKLLSCGRILYWPEARFTHRGGVSAGRLGYARFLPLYYRNALVYRQARYTPAARAAYRVLLVAGMALRLIALPLRRRLPRSRGESARAYLRVLLLALGGGVPRPPQSLP